MSRYVDADVLIRKIQEGHKFGSLTITELISECPTADVVEVVHGEWVKDVEASKETLESIYVCSACHNFEAWGETEKYNYCPNCGAKMDAERREDEQIH